MSLPLPRPYPPMEARAVDELPGGAGWQFEPKWDGFRCLAFRDGDAVELQSKAGRPLARYFPDVVEALLALGARRFVLDGELVIPVDRALSFEALQLRLHPAASRVAKLAAEHPALYVAFDLLVDEGGTSWVDRPLVERREALERFARAYVEGSASVRLSPATRDRAQAESWLGEQGEGLDGVVAKRLSEPYHSGEREGMLKIKQAHTVDCVVAGFRYGANGRSLGSLLLGLHDGDGVLHHVGHVSGLSREDRARLLPELEELRDARDPRKGFDGRSPGGPSRWSREREGEFESLPHRLVVEVGYDHFSGGRFRHGARFVRWRPDKAPEQCGLDQLPPAGHAARALLEERRGSGRKREPPATSGGR